MSIRSETHPIPIRLLTPYILDGYNAGRIFVRKIEAGFGKIEFEQQLIVVWSNLAPLSGLSFGRLNYIMNCSKFRLFLLIGWTVLISLVACDGWRNESLIPQQPGTRPANVIAESDFLNTSTPGASLLLGPTQTFTDTASSSPKPYATPTIFAAVTPSGNATDFQLKEWSELAALELVQEAKSYAQAFLQADMDWYFQRNGYMQAHEVIELAAKEAIQRFPDTPSRERLEWLIVLSESLLSATRYGQEPPNDRILALLETGLNDGSYDLNDLDAALNPFGFGVRRNTPYGESIPQYATNLFGNNQRASIVVISRIAGDPLLAGSVNGFVDDDGFIFAIRRNEQGKYVPLLVESGWVFSTSGYESIKVDDVTADGIPEIEVVFYAHNGSMYDRGIRVWHWRNGHFVDLVDEIRMGAPSQWNFGISDLDGKPMLQTSEFVNGVGGPITTTYAWDGSFFEPVSIEFVNWPDEVAVPTLPSSEPVGESNPTPAETISEGDIIRTEIHLLENADTETPILMLESLLATPSIKSVGRYNRPRLYYLLALAYEVSDSEEFAVKNYWYIWQHYPDSPYSLLSQAKLEKKP
jgi:hypothetical protein